MRHLWILTLALLWNAGRTTAQDLLPADAWKSMMEALENASADSVPAKPEKEILHSTLKTLESFNEDYRENFNQWKLRGSASLMLNATEARDRKLYVLGGSIDLGTGIYPIQFEFKTSYLVQLDNGSLEDKVTNTFVSMDFHPLAFREKQKNYTMRDPLLLETYVFFNQSSNSFLQIDGRYEMGAGIVVASWGKNIQYFKRQSADAVKNPRLGVLEDLRLISEDLYIRAVEKNNEKEVGDTEWTDSDGKRSHQDSRRENSDTLDLRYWKAFDDQVNGGKMQQALKEAVPDIEYFKHYMRKKEMRFRVGLLAGFKADIEEASVTDSVFVVADDGVTIVQEPFEYADLPPQVSWQLTLRPIVEASNGLITLKVRPYFHLPVIRRNPPTAVPDTTQFRNDASFATVRDYLLGGRKGRYNMRIDLRTSLSYDVKLKRVPFIESIGIEASHNYQYDHAPRTVWVADARFPEGRKYQQIQAPKSYHNVSFSLKVKI